VVVKRGERSNNLLKHELVHTCQYDRFGIEGFAQRYADQYVDSGYSYNNMEFEIDAFGFQGMNDASTPRINTYRGQDGGNADWYSGCR
jgi:hypothetical protein